MPQPDRKPAVGLALIISGFLALIFGASSHSVPAIVVAVIGLYIGIDMMKKWLRTI